MSVIDLIDEYKDRGGMLGLLKEYMKKVEELSNKLYEIWKKAFPRTRVTGIKPSEAGRFYGLFRGILSRARPERRKELNKYFKEFEKVYKELRELMPFPYSVIKDLINRGEKIYNINNYTDYKVFLKDLHEWINDVCYVFGIHRKSIEKYFPDIYKYIYKMIKVVVDISTEYVGPAVAKGVRGAFEFTYGTFVHIENFVHVSSKELDTGIFMPYLMYIIMLMKELAAEYAYEIVFPAEFGGGAIGDWDIVLTQLPFEVTNEDLPYEVNKKIVALAAQLGIDVKDHVVELKKISEVSASYVDEFPAYYVILDYRRGVIRVEAEAILPWDYYKYTIEEIVMLFR